MIDPLRDHTNIVARLARSICGPREHFVVVLVNEAGDVRSDSDLPTADVVGLLAAMVDVRSRGVE